MSFSRLVTTCAAAVGRVIAAAAALAYFAAPANAQITPPPLFSSSDANGVDLTSGQYRFPGFSLAIGDPAAGGLVYTTTRTRTGRADNFIGTINKTGAVYTVSLSSGTETFTLTSGTYVSNQRRGSTLTFNSSTQLYTYTTRDGSQAIFQKGLASTGNVTPYAVANEARIISMTGPSGDVLTYSYSGGAVCFMDEITGCTYEYYFRLDHIDSSLGYRIDYGYAGDYLPEVTYGGDPQINDWFNVIYVTAINLAVDCAACTPTVSWPKMSYTYGPPGTETDNLGRTTTLAPGITSPEGRTFTFTTQTTSPFRVTSVTHSGQTWTYSYVQAGGNLTTTVTDPDGKTRVVVTNLSTGLATSDTNELGKTTSYLYDTYGHITRVTAPEGNYVQYAYDARGNVTQVTRVAKPGSGLANVVTSASYPTTCTNTKTCNQPTSTTDARGYRTDYTYDATHGGVLTVTYPNADPSVAAPGQTGTRAQTRYTYAQFQSRYRTGPSTWANGAAVWRLTATSACATTMSCANGADETVTTIAYPGSGTANNVQPTSTTTRAGNSAVSATTAVTYTEVGDVKTQDGPLSGSADTVRYYYDAARQLTAVVGPDPDGGGALLFRAARTTYNLDGQPTLVENGTATGQTGTAPPGFAVLEKQETLYDAYGRVAQSLLRNASTNAVIARTQQSYDVVGRPRCTAVRMTPTATPPSDACAIGTASDRISRTSYNAAGAVSQVESAVGTSLAQVSATTTYTNNGLPATLTDARGYRMTTEYDGFDRPVKLRHPVPGTTGSSSTTDYEQMTYDAYSRLTQERRRSGAIFINSYDNLGRVTLRNAPGSEPDVATAYDLFSRVTVVSHGGETLTTAYDQLSRATSVTSSVLGAVSYLYDAAGRRTRITYPGPNNLYVTYDWNVAGEVTAIREQGASSGAGVLATYAYDNLGRRTSITRGNGATTSYTYDPVSRLATLTQNLSGTSHDNTLTYGFSAASQLTSRTRTNSAYDWVVPASATTSYAANGLNQYTSVASFSPTYDGNGNLTNDGAKTYGYDADSKLLTVSGGVTLAYDPAGRLHQIVQGGATTRFLYDGADIIAESNASGTVLRRYVHGPGVDEPIVWYEGSALTDRRWLLADERGSVIAVTNGSGSVITVNKYDEYGKPAAGNLGRFQFTGQIWLPEAGLYHFKARAYHPGWGRFLQTDPIGTRGGMNLYGYCGNDPINCTDPDGELGFLAAFAIGFFVNAAIQLVTTGEVDIGQAAISGVVAGIFEVASAAYAAQAKDAVAAGSAAAGGAGAASGAAAATTPVASGVGRIIDIAGKIWNLPNTAIGTVYGIGGWIIDKSLYVLSFGRINFHTKLIWFQHNALVEVYNHPLSKLVGGGLTLGNVVTYSGSPTDSGLTGIFYRNAWRHEIWHTYQGQILGPLYLPANAIGGLASTLTGGGWHGSLNFMETGPNSRQRLWP